MTTEPIPVRRPRGRPADPAIEARVMKAAIGVYAEVGWAGFTFDAIAARSGVGKAALYRRWDSKLAILEAAWRDASVGFVEVPDLGDIRSDMLALAQTLIVRLEEPVGVFELRMMLDSKIFPDEFDFTGVRSREFARAAVDRGIAAGELPEGTRPEYLFDLIRGAIIHNFLVVPKELDDRRRAKAPAYAEDIVDVVLAGVRSTASR